MSANADAYAWIGASGGSWGVAANWQDTTTATTPALFIPGSGTPVSIVGAAGAGFTVINGGGVTASLTVVANASLTGDTTTGALAVGTRTVPAAGDAAYVAGALSVVSSSLVVSTVTVASGTFSLAGKGASIAAGGMVRLGSAPLNLGAYFDTGAVGALNLGEGTMLLAGALLVNQGSLAVSGAKAGIAGSVSLGAVGGAAGADKAAGFLLVTAGGTLAIGGGLTETYGAVVVGGSLSRLAVQGDFIASTPAYSGASPFGYHSLVATGFGRAELGGIVILATPGGTIPANFAVDLTGAIEVGTLGTAAAGSITVDAGRSIISAANAVLTGSIVNNGAIVSTGGTLTLAGNLSGSGEVRIGRNATLALDGNAAATGTIVFTDTGATLAIGSTGVAVNTVLATISGFQLGDSIVVGGVHADSVLYQPAGAGGGTLFLFGGSTVLASLTLAGSYSNSDFVLSPTDVGATSIGLLPPITSGTPTGTSPNTDAYAWTGVSGGSWKAASNWRDTTSGADPAAFVPGAATPVSIVGPVAGAFQVVTGGGSSQSLAVLGNVGLNGFYDTGALTLGSRTLLAGGSAGYASGTLALTAGAGLAAGSVVVVSGTLALTGSTLAADGPVSFGSAPLNLDFQFDTGAVGIGRVGAGATLSVGGALAVNQGTLTVSGTGAEADLAGAVTLGAIGADRAAGFLVVGNGGRLTAAGDLTAIYGGVVVSGAGSRLIVGGSLIAGPPAYFGASPFGYYTLAATAGGSAQVGGILIAPSAGMAIAAAIAVDLTGAIEVGTAGTGTAGTITIDAGRSIDAAADAVLTGAIVNNGTISETGGSLTLAGSLSGSGVLRIGAGATVVLGGSVAGTGQIVFAGAGAGLVIGSRTAITYANGIPVVTRTPYAVAARISGLAAGDNITVSNAAITGARYVATAPASAR
jgi:fibronectin-binding autotransporter adhesin